jgi:hypothetical protein
MATLNSEIVTQGAWKGPEIDYRKDGLHVFSDAEVAEIDRALRHLKSLGERDLPDIDREGFPLDTVGVLMEKLRDTLRFGRGFVMLRGIPRERYDADDMARIYFGLGCYLGTPINQSHAGDMLGHVIDVNDVEPKARAYRKGGQQQMHCDSCDVVALMCVRAARTGGVSRIASALAVYNEILRTRPDLAQALRDGFYYGRAEQDALHATSAVSREPVPVLAENASGEVSCYFLGGYARNAEKYGYPLTPLQTEAIATFERLAASEQYYLDMSFSEGDIQLLNNRILVHGRTDYADHSEMTRRRHLMRLWLAMPEWPPVTEAQIFHKAADHALWAKNRRPFMELPSVHFRTLMNAAAAA